MVMVAGYSDFCCKKKERFAGDISIIHRVSFSLYSPLFRYVVSVIVLKAQKAPFSFPKDWGEGRKFCLKTH
jgi:hypothetical protein